MPTDPYCIFPQLLLGGDLRSAMEEDTAGNLLWYQRWVVSLKTLASFAHQATRLVRGGDFSMAATPSTLPI